jgi:hypothetical protein
VKNSQISAEDAIESPGENELAMNFAKKFPMRYVGGEGQDGNKESDSEVEGEDKKDWRKAGRKKKGKKGKKAGKGGERK